MRWRIGKIATAAGLILALALGLVLHEQFGDGIRQMDAWIDARPVGIRAVGEIGTAIGALGAFAAAFMAVLQLGDQRAVARWSSSRDSLWRFTDRWNQMRE
jgi:hypothetical protein